MSDIKVRVGQQNAIKIVSSISGSASGRSTIAENVIGGIGSIRELNVSGVSTFVGISTFKNDVYIDESLYIGGNLVIETLAAGGAIIVPNVVITGLATISSLSYGTYFQNGVAYFNSTGILTSTTGPSSSINFTNYILTTNNNNVPTWASTIDGGSY